MFCQKQKKFFFLLFLTTKKNGRMCQKTDTRRPLRHLNIKATVFYTLENNISQKSLRVRKHLLQNVFSYYLKNKRHLLWLVKLKPFKAICYTSKSPDQQENSEIFGSQIFQIKKKYFWGKKKFVLCNMN